VVIEKRLHARVPVGAPLTCHRPDGRSFAGNAKDISIGGMFLETPQPVEFGDELRIEILLPRAKQPFALPAVVRWVKPGGFGVQFGLLGARETHAISELLRG
jgi:type IV pilus assembly protein PilZ